VLPPRSLTVAAPGRTQSHTMRKAIFLAVIPVALGIFAYWRWSAKPTGETDSPPRIEVPVVETEAPAEQVREFCAVCHAYPPPSSFPRPLWRKEVRLAYDFFRESPLRGTFPSLESVVRYYERNAPEKLDSLPPDG